MGSSSSSPDDEPVGRAVTPTRSLGSPFPRGLRQRWPWMRRWLTLLRPLPLLVVLAWLVQRSGSPVPAGAEEPDLNRATARALTEAGLETEAGDVHYIDPPPGALDSRFAEPRALVRAHTPNAPSDIYLVRVELSPEGRLLEISGTYNLSDTSAVDERDLVVSGQRAAWTIGGGGKTYSVQLADLAGEPTPRGPGWSRFKLWQHRITNLQSLGQSEGVVRRSFRLDPAANTARITFAGSALAVSADQHRIRIPLDGGKIEGQRYVREQKHHVARPGNLVTWAVDRVRAMPWFGSDRMQLVKAIAFEGLDYVQRTWGAVTGDDGAEDVAEEMGALLEMKPVTYTDPETGWPPPPMEPMLKPLEGEGKWRSLESDPFVRKNPGAPSPFLFSFIRTDSERKYVRVYVTLWDPRQVELSTMSGTIEPKSATGETGPGLVPREPEVMGRLVAGLNGGFQATHGEWGMMANDVVYLPPKPYAATVVVLDDGSTGFGTWPKNEVVPDNVVGFRQNMTPLVMDGVVNPYKRNWWGGVPPGWEDKSRTVRSGICLTQEKFVAYLYGAAIDAEHLRIAMQRARCEYGIHLDMNPGHTGLEFYTTAPTDELPDLGRPLDPKWEATGKVRGMKGWSFIGRRMIRFMGLMNFPRYINREARDFFYLTLRHVLPGEPVPTVITPPEAGEGQWKLDGLPQFGWPYAVATGWVRPDAARPDTKLRLLKLDPKTLKPTKASSTHEVVVAFNEPVRRGERAVWLHQGRFAVGQTPPSGATLITRGAPYGSGRAAKAALGIAPGGILVYAEVSTAPRPAADAAMLEGLLAKLGCHDRVLLKEPLAAALGGERDLSGHPLARASDAVVLARGEAPGGRRVFRDTPVVPPSEWYALQAKRVRYFKKKEKPAPDDSEGAGSDGAAGADEAAGSGGATESDPPAGNPGAAASDG